MSGNRDHSQPVEMLAVPIMALVVVAALALADGLPWSFSSWLQLLP